MADSERYDRQIRLWGENGQASLSRAEVLMVGSTATATETLKNLVLPGIASFTIVDDAPCSSTLAQNFFVTKDDDSPSSEEAAVNLGELNPLVRAHFIAAGPASFLNEHASAVSFVSRFSLVIVAQQGGGHAVFRTLARAAAEAHVPFMQVRSYGALGLIRIQFPISGGSACVEHDRDDKAQSDLRLHAPFPELHEAAQAARKQLSDPGTASSVPFVLILLIAASDFVATHGELPKTRDECKELQNIALALQPEGCPEDAQNFEEVKKFRNLLMCRKVAGELPYNVRELFADPRSDPDVTQTAPTPELTTKIEGLPSPIRVAGDIEPTRVTAGGELAPFSAAPITASARIRAEDRAFWVHVAAVRRFHTETGQLPLGGALPDMAADTRSYVALQRLFTAKAAEDAKSVLTYASEITERRGLSSEAPADASSVAAFCKTVRQAHVVRSRTINDELEYQGTGGFLENARDSGAFDNANSNLASAYYPLFRAVDDFFREHGRVPDSEADTPLVRTMLAKVKEKLGGVPSELWSDETEEMIRFAGVELHNVAALIGGIAGQEAVKIITRQFVPLNNTIIVNSSNMTTFSFPA